MKGRHFILFLFIFLFFSNQTHAKTLLHPPIPINNTSQIAIIIVEDESALNKLLQKIKATPTMELRHIFHSALTGFSVKASRKDLEKLKADNHVLHVSQISTYQVQASESSIPFIGSQKIRRYFDQKNQRLTGKGVRVGVIDTGIDYTHPDLRKNYGGGKDLVDGDRDPMETKSFREYNTFHGTHVAGVIAANGKMQGVAPEAELIAYRALGPGGMGTTEQVLAAIEAAIKDQVDIMNLSLGNSINGPDLPISMALNKAVEKGIVAVTSNGNSGPNVWTVGAPGTSSKAISVGASSPPMKVPYLLMNKQSFRMEPFAGTINWDLDRSIPLVDGGIGKKNQLQHAKDKIVLIERGELSFSEKVKNATRAGAKAVIIYNNTTGAFVGSIEEGIKIPVAGMEKKIGEKVKKAIKEKDVYVQIENCYEQDVLADFSSRGPVTATWEIKPDVLAPGVAIHSTVPGGYLPMQGTSMAAPHVTGACALIKQAHPDWTPQQIKAALMNTALPLKNIDGSYYRTFEQGSGRIRLVEAVQAQTLVYPSSIHFGPYSLEHEEKGTYLTVENVSDEPKNYSFSIPKREDGLRWRLPLSFSLQPNEKRKIKVEVFLDQVHSAKMRDGYIFIQEGQRTIPIPYLIVSSEPNYPRVMGFELVKGDKENTIRYEVYLPGGAEEFGIALFDPSDLTFQGFLDTAHNVKRGMLEKEVSINNLPSGNHYLAKIFAKKGKREDYIEAEIFLKHPE